MGKEMQSFIAPREREVIKTVRGPIVEKQGVYDFEESNINPDLKVKPEGATRVTSINSRFRSGNEFQIVSSTSSALRSLVDVGLLVAKLPSDFVELGAERLTDKVIEILTRAFLPVNVIRDFEVLFDIERKVKQNGSGNVDDIIYCSLEAMAITSFRKKQGEGLAQVVVSVGGQGAKSVTASTSSGSDVKAMSAIALSNPDNSTLYGKASLSSKVRGVAQVIAGKKDAIKDILKRGLEDTKKEGAQPQSTLKENLSIIADMITDAVRRDVTSVVISSFLFKVKMIDKPRYDAIVAAAINQAQIEEKEEKEEKLEKAAQETTAESSQDGDIDNTTGEDRPVKNEDTPKQLSLSDTTTVQAGDLALVGFDGIAAVARFAHFQKLMPSDPEAASRLAMDSPNANLNRDQFGDTDLSDSEEEAPVILGVLPAEEMRKALVGEPMTSRFLSNQLGNNESLEEGSEGVIAIDIPEEIKEVLGDRAVGMSIPVTVSRNSIGELSLSTKPRADSDAKGDIVRVPFSTLSDAVNNIRSGRSSPSLPRLRESINSAGRSNSASIDVDIDEFGTALGDLGISNIGDGGRIKINLNPLLE